MIVGTVVKVHDEIIARRLDWQDSEPVKRLGSEQLGKHILVVLNMEAVNAARKLQKHSVYWY